MTIYLISRLSINRHKYVTVFLDLQILNDFVVKYLPLPKRYDTDFNVPLSIDHLSLKNSRNIFGHCRILASDATWKLHANQAYLNITIILFWQKEPIKKIYRHLKTRLTKNCTRRESNVQWLWDLRRNWKLRFFRDSRHQNIQSKIAVFVVWRCYFEICSQNQLLAFEPLKSLFSL